MKQVFACVAFLVPLPLLILLHLLFFFFLLLLHLASSFSSRCSNNNNNDHVDVCHEIANAKVIKKKEEKLFFCLWVLSFVYSNIVRQARWTIERKKNRDIKCLWIIDLCKLSIISWNQKKSYQLSFSYFIYHLANFPHFHFPFFFSVTP